MTEKSSQSNRIVNGPDHGPKGIRRQVVLGALTILTASMLAACSMKSTPIAIPVTPTPIIAPMAIFTPTPVELTPTPTIVEEPTRTPEPTPTATPSFELDPYSDRVDLIKSIDSMEPTGLTPIQKLLETRKTVNIMDGFGLIHRFVQRVDQKGKGDDAPIGYAIVDETQMIDGKHFLVRTITGRVSKVVEQKSDDPTKPDKTRTVIFLDEDMGNEGQFMIVIDTSYDIGTEHNFGTDGMTSVVMPDGTYHGVIAGSSNIQPGAIVSAPFIKPDLRYDSSEKDWPYDLVEVQIIEDPEAINATTLVNMKDVSGQIEVLNTQQAALLRDKLKDNLESLYEKALDITDTSVETDRLRSVLAAIDNDIRLTGSGEELVLNLDLNPEFLGEVDPPLNFDQVFEGIDITSFTDIKRPFGWEDAFLLYLSAWDTDPNSVEFRTLMDKTIQGYVDQTGLLSSLNTLGGVKVKIVAQSPDH